MAGSNEMPEVNFQNIENDKKLKQAYIYAKHVEEKNKLRSFLGARKLRTGRILGLTCGLFGVSIYIYTFNRVKQETFLDDWEEPEIPGVQ